MRQFLRLKQTMSVNTCIIAISRNSLLDRTFLLEAGDMMVEGSSQWNHRKITYYYVVYIENLQNCLAAALVV